MVNISIKSLVSQPSGGAPRSVDASTDYPVLWPDQHYDPPGTTYEQRLEALWSMADELGAKSQDISDQVDKACAHPTLPAGYTYFGQFVGHDMSWHRFEAKLGAPSPQHRRLVNLRRRKIELEVLYGNGPTASQLLYRRDAPAYFRLGTESEGNIGQWNRDLPRDSEGRAILVDPRQDETVMISQLHLSLLRAHNKIVDAISSLKRFNDPLQCFEAARRILTWHYQWTAVTDFLPRMIDVSSRQQLRVAIGEFARQGSTRLSVFGERDPFLPAEFAFAVYRFGHSLARERYQLQKGPSGYEFAMTPLDRSAGWFTRGGPFLMLFRPLPRDFGVNWRLFLPSPEGEPQRARTIGPRVSWSLSSLPTSPGESRRQASLSFLNLRAGWDEPMHLTSGRDAARSLGLEPHSNDSTPLWLYILKEAESLAGGATLGPVGSTMMWQVMLGQLISDEDSYLHADPSWKPYLGRMDGCCELWDLVSIADQKTEWVAERIAAHLP